MSTEITFSSRLVKMLTGLVLFTITCAGIGLAIGVGWRAYNWAKGEVNAEQTQNCSTYTR